MLRREIGQFIGASLINAPLTFALTWILFKVFARSRLPRVTVVIVSCFIVSVALGFLSGDEDYYFKFQSYQQIWIGIWLIIGLIFWGKRKKLTK